MIACATTVPRVDLPESGAEPKAVSTQPEPRTDGRSDGPRPRRLAVRFVTGEDELRVEGYCREQVWTTLQKRAAIPFVVRESWSRLGSRRAQRIARTKDSVFQGVLARLRPTGEGRVDFVVEISVAGVGPRAEKFEWQGETIEMPVPYEQGYRFEGSVPAGYRGELAGWGELRISIEDSAPPSNAVPELMDFVSGETPAFVTDTPGALAEHYRVRVQRVAPYEKDHDGIVQALFRLKRERVAVGMQKDDEKGWQGFGHD